MEQKWILGIDTSNYKTSAALTTVSGSVIGDRRRFLEVKQGERGLRQQDALFQHLNALPGMLRDLFGEARAAHPEGRVTAVSVSTRPRPVEGSYMPVFLAGKLAAEAAASSLGVPLYECSHQEGHIEAARHGTVLQDCPRFVCFHFSGGTTEAVLADQDCTELRDRYRIVGGTKDIAFGQVLDRVGVTLGMHFPCGEEMDRLASDKEKRESVPFTRAAGEGIPDSALTGVRVRGGFCNLSGLETQASRLAKEAAGDPAKETALIRLLFRRITRAIAVMTLQIAEETNADAFLFAGGVSSSTWIRQHLEEELKRRAGRDRKIPRICFGRPEMAPDNAVGTALLGGKRYAAETDQRITAE